VLLTGLLVAGCGGAKRPTIESQDNSSAESADMKRLREILDRRARAVQQKDESAFLADLDRSNEKLLQHEKMVFANLRQFKFNEFRYITDRILSGTEDKGEYAFGPVIQIAQLPVDAGPGGVAPAETFQYRLVRKDGKLVVKDIAPTTQDNAQDVSFNGPLANAPWNFGPLRVIQAGNVWLASDGSVSELDRYAAAAEDEARKVEALWGDRLRFPGHVLFFTRDPASFRTWFGLGTASNFDESVEGFQIPLNGVRKDGRVYDGQYAAARVVVNLKSTDLFKDDPRLVIRHELAHAVTCRATASTPGFAGLGAPTWAVEGFARWVEGLDNAAAKSGIRARAASGVAAGTFNGQLPLTKTFYGKDVGFNYDVSSTIFAYIERSKGRDTAVEFYANVIKYTDMIGTPFTQLPAFQGICERVLGKSNGALLQDWAGFVRGGA
jgi:hypothetical protein